MLASELVRLLWIVMRVKIKCSLRCSLPHSAHITPFSAPTVSLGIQLDQALEQIVALVGF